MLSCQFRSSSPPPFAADSPARFNLTKAYFLSCAWSEAAAACQRALIAVRWLSRRSHTARAEGSAFSGRLRCHIGVQRDANATAYASFSCVFSCVLFSAFLVYEKRQIETKHKTKEQQSDFDERCYRDVSCSVAPSHSCMQQLSMPHEYFFWDFLFKSVADFGWAEALDSSLLERRPFATFVKRAAQTGLVVSMNPISGALETKHGYIIPCKNSPKQKRKNGLTITHLALLYSRYTIQQKR